MRPPHLFGDDPGQRHGRRRCRAIIVSARGALIGVADGLGELSRQQQEVDQLFVPRKTAPVVGRSVERFGQRNAAFARETATAAQNSAATIDELPVPLTSPSSSPSPEAGA